MTLEQIEKSFKKSFRKCKLLEKIEYLHSTVFVLKRRRKRRRGNIEIEYRRGGL